VTTTAQTDVVIIGGGPAGTATAVALTRAGLRVILIERSSYDAFRLGETVPPDLQSVLQALGAWSSFEQDAYLPSRGVASTWGSTELAFGDALFSSQGGGWHLDRVRFDTSLAREAERGGAEIWTGTRLASFARIDGDRWSLTVHTHNGVRQLRASFLVDATGRSATVARRCGAKKIYCDRLVAVYALFGPCSDSQADLHTLVEAAQHGWWYASRLPGNQAVVSFLSDSDLVRRYALHRLDPWCALLDRSLHIRDFLADALRCSEPTLRSAASHCLDPVVGEGWLAVGDAASAFDPLSSAGIVLALRAGFEVATVLTQHLSGDRLALSHYDQRIHLRFAHYLAARHFYYALETRWPDSEFWQRRRADLLDQD